MTDAESQTGKRKPTVLVVDDDESGRNAVAAILESDGNDMTVAGTVTEAIAAFRSRYFDVVVQDIKMPDGGGIRLLREYKYLRPDAIVIILTAYTTSETATEAMRLGAYDYMMKPYDNRDLKTAVARAARHAQRLRERGRRAPDTGLPTRFIIGSSTGMKEVMDIVRRVAATESTVLITGESGTGKELVAHALHYESHRSNEPFLAVNCGAFTETLLESELFGHMKGSFTGAIADKKGLFEVASGGTLFLDEITEMSTQMQVKLLRVLAERVVMPVGSTKQMEVDVRVVASSNRNVHEAVQAGLFRQDLLYRLNVIDLAIPPLRERRDDIPLFAGHFLAKHSRTSRKKVSSFTCDALDVLRTYDWPGNVRELESVVQRAIALCDSDTIDAKDLGSFGKVMSCESWPIDLQARLEEVEARYISEALQRTNYKMTEAAELLKMTFRQLRYKVEKYNLGKAAR
jgi:two-component system response regulator PilR (NtrC family)